MVVINPYKIHYEEKKYFHIRWMKLGQNFYKTKTEFKYFERQNIFILNFIP